MLLEACPSELLHGTSCLAAGVALPSFDTGAP